MNNILRLCIQVYIIIHDDVFYTLCIRLVINRLYYILYYYYYCINTKQKIIIIIIIIIIVCMPINFYGCVKTI